MRIAVAGATGHIGALTAAALERGGHDVVRISRSLGVDLLTGDGLDAALAGVEAVVARVEEHQPVAFDVDQPLAGRGQPARGGPAPGHRPGRWLRRLAGRRAPGHPSSGRASLGSRNARPMARISSSTVTPTPVSFSSLRSAKAKLSRNALLPL